MLVRNAARSRPAWRRAGHHTTAHRRSSRLFPSARCSIRRATRQGACLPASGPSRAARHVVADLWRQADHYVTRPRRSSRLFPKRVLYSAGDPTRGRLDLNLRSGTQTIASSPDLCKSGAESVKICFFSTASAQHNRHIGLNGVSPYSTDGRVLTKIQHLRG